MSPLQLYLIIALALTAFMAFAAARFAIFQKDLRRPVCATVGLLAMLTLVLSIHVLGAAFDLRNAGLAAHDASLIARGNGLILGGIVLLLVSALAFFFALGVYLWSLIPAPRLSPSAPKSTAFNPFAGFDRGAQTLNPSQER